MRAATAGRLRPRLGIVPQVLIGLLVLGLFGALAIEPTRQLLDQRQRISGMTKDFNKVERSNERLAARIDRLKDPDFLEQRARSLGLVRPGETTYIVMPPSKPTKKERRRAARRKHDIPPPEPSFFESFVRFLGIP